MVQPSFKPCSAAAPENLNEGKGVKRSAVQGWGGVYRRRGRTLPTWQFSEQYVNGGLPVVETSHAPLVPVVPAGAAGQVVPVHLGRQHSWDASGKWTAVSPELQPVPVLPGFDQWLPAGVGGPGLGGGDGPPPQVNPQMPLAQCAPVGQSEGAVQLRVQSVGGGLPVFETSHCGLAVTPAPGAGHVVPVQAGRQTHIPATLPAISPAMHPEAGLPATLAAMGERMQGPERRGSWCG
eukprot:COSAG06_NODE_6776_length_2765_cov_3.468006_1_plen_236_part_00